MGKTGNLIAGAGFRCFQQLIPGRGHFAAGGSQHVFVVEQDQVVASEGHAVQFSVEGAGVDGARIVGAHVKLAGNVGEYAHGGIRGMVGIVQDHQIRQRVRGRADGQLLFEISKGNVLGGHLDVALAGIELLNDVAQRLLMAFGLPVVPDLDITGGSFGERPGGHHTGQQADNEQNTKQFLHFPDSSFIFVLSVDSDPIMFLIRRKRNSKYLKKGGIN